MNIHVKQPIEEMLASAGLELQPDYHYRLTTPARVHRRTTEGYDVLVENIEGSAGERFILVGKQVEQAPEPVPDTPPMYSRVIRKKGRSKK